MMTQQGPPTPRSLLPLALCAGALLFASFAPAADAPPKQAATSATATPAANTAATTDSSAPSTQPAGAVAPKPGTTNGVSVGPQELIRLNFKGAPLGTVLEYLSKTAGFVVIRPAELTGTVDVESHQPLNHTEVVELLNSVLGEKGLVAIKTDRTLRIVPREEAKKYDLPVQSGADPEEIHKAESMITQIIPIRYANAPKLLENLQPLVPSYANLSANESSNALIITDTQTNVRRIASIIEALDTSISSVSEVKVFPLQHAVAEELAEVVNKVFTTPSTQSNRRSSAGDRMRSFFMRMRGGGGGDDNNQQQDGNRAASVKVTAVGDERSNSLVVSAPGDLFDDIELLVEQVDVPTEETRSLRVFPLKFAEAEDIAEAVNELFEQESSTSNNNRGRTMGGPFGMRGGFGSTRGGGGTSRGRTGGSSSDRKLQEAEVTAVADSRTNSVIVTASNESLTMIADMIERLDATPQNVPQVYIYRIKHADLERLQEMLEGMFDDLDSTSGTSSATATGGAGRTLTNTAATVRRP
ncbi:MAG: hypothetical protein HN742_02980 [Lentisphaerae bacterium]|jgi:general secretion pathway protein D|nr:hypothetical protein [Lentisphaerota bacterium]MBT4814920.1 hypothetical protein [Lentisphaerota bacterium]MBT5605433.1 hypothetical protein [Lentisphaerota bacterium]MBT7060136.1 hypothetical protein [Lentisphaerota bacterium]MBT7840804.1 hypothetical protein [Lentisphaerota bacterium]